MSDERFIYAPWSQHTDQPQVFISVTGRPGNSTCGDSLTDHGGHDYPCSTCMAKFPDTIENRQKCPGGYWFWADDIEAWEYERDWVDEDECPVPTGIGKIE